MCGFRFIFVLEIPSSNKHHLPKPFPAAKQQQNKNKDKMTKRGFINTHVQAHVSAEGTAVVPVTPNIFFELMASLSPLSEFNAEAWLDWSSGIQGMFPGESANSPQGPTPLLVFFFLLICLLVFSP